MPKSSSIYKKPAEAPSNYADTIDIPIKFIEKMLLLGDKGPLNDVEEVIFPEPFSPISSRTPRKRVRNKPGPKSSIELLSEVRKVWSNINSEDKLAKSWLASLSPVQKLADLKYGGVTIGKGIALKEILVRALAEAQKHQTDEKTHEMLIRYPKSGIATIAAKFGLSREHFSRHYATKATYILAVTLKRVLDQPV